MNDMVRASLIESAGYSMGKKKLVIGKDSHSILLRLPRHIFNRLQALADRHENSLNREIAEMIHHATEDSTVL